jgi:hypothetical protein
MILRGLIRRITHTDLVLVQDTECGGRPDPEVLEGAALMGRIVLTHDANTMVDAAYERLTEGKSLPGLIVVSQGLPIGPAIEDLTLILECSSHEEWAGRVFYLPL